MRNKLSWPLALFLLSSAFTSDLSPQTFAAGGRAAHRLVRYEVGMPLMPLAYVSTVIVSPTRGNPVASGNTLLQAVQGITNASAANPYVVKIEPGNYDLGTNTLQMKPYVDIEGSGQGVTTITGRGQAVIAAANFAELRALAVNNVGFASSATGVAVGATSPRISNVSITLTGANRCAADCSGITISSTSTLMLTEVTIKVTSRSTQNRGISGNAARGRLFLNRVSIEVSGAWTYNDGIVFTGGGLSDPPLVLTAVDSNITVYGPTSSDKSSPAGISSYKDILRLTNVTITSPLLGVVLGGYGKSQLTIDRSSIQGRGRLSVYFGAQTGFARIGGSKLDGPVSGFARCASSYDGQYQPLDAACK